MLITILIVNYILEKMPWPERFERGKEDMFKSKLRFQIRHEDFRQRISQVLKLHWYPKFSTTLSYFLA